MIIVFEKIEVKKKSFCIILYDIGKYKIYDISLLTRLLRSFTSSISAIFLYFCHQNDLFNRNVDVANIRYNVFKIKNLVENLI